MQALVEAYGLLALAVWWALFLVVWLGSAALIGLGFDRWLTSPAEAEAGGLTVVAALTAAYVFAKTTTPVRVLVVAAATPVVARVFGIRPRPAAEDAESEAGS